MTKIDKKNDLTTNLFGYKIYSSDKFTLLNFLDIHLSRREKTISIFTPNPEQIVLAKSDKKFAKYLGFAGILIPDGVGLLFGASFLSFFGKCKAIDQRITGIDLTKDLLKLAEEKDLKVMVIGGRGYENGKYDGWEVANVSNVAKVGDWDGQSANKSATNGTNRGKAKKDFQVITQNRKIWWTEGFSDANNQTKDEVSRVEAAISQIKPDVVFVALGAPNQEKWVYENFKFLEQNKVSIAMVVGGTFDVLFGKVSRAPKWMQNLGLEWLYRLIEEPWRWRRQMKLLRFVGLVVGELFL